jgi:hypothetical protein
MFSANQLKRPLRNKLSFLHLENYAMHEVFLSKNHSVFTGKNVLDATASNINCVLWRDTCVSSIQFIRLVWKKNEPTPHRKF